MQPQTSTSPNSWQGKQQNGSGGFPGIVTLTTGLARHKLELLLDSESKMRGAQSYCEQGINDDDSMEMQLAAISSLLNALIDAEVSRRNMPKKHFSGRKPFTERKSVKNRSDELTSAPDRPGVMGGCYDVTTESDAPMSQNLYTSGAVIGEAAIGAPSETVKCAAPSSQSTAQMRGGTAASTCNATTLLSLTPFILSTAFECPFADIRAAYQPVLRRMRDELGIAVPDAESWEKYLSASSPWFRLIGNEDASQISRSKKAFDAFVSRAQYYIENGEVPCQERFLFSHWAELAQGHNSTLQKLLYSTEGPLPLFDRLVCALIAAAVHGAEPLSRYIAALLMRGGFLHRRNGESSVVGEKAGASRSATTTHSCLINSSNPTLSNDSPVPGQCSSCAAADSCGAGNALRDKAWELFKLETWPERYRVIRRVCAILARKPWMLRRADLDPILNHWSEPEMIHMLTIFSYFLGLSSLMVVLKVPCDLSISYEVAHLLAIQHQRTRGGTKGGLVNNTTKSAREEEESSEGSSDSDETEQISETDDETRAVRSASAVAAQTPVWTTSEPLLSQLVEGGDNADIVYTKRISKGKGSEYSLATSMFSFEDGARSMLDIYFPTVAEDLASEFDIFSSIVAGESITQINYEMQRKEKNTQMVENDLLVRVSYSLKLGPSTKPNLAGTPTADPVFVSACTPTPPPQTPSGNVGSSLTSPHQQLEIKDVEVSAFWEAIRIYSMNVGGVVDLSYDYCNINNHVGKFAKTFALSATVQPTSDPAEAPYGDPLILPTNYEEEECILALGLQAMYSKIEALLLRSLSTAK